MSSVEVRQTDRDAAADFLFPSTHGDIPNVRRWHDIKHGNDDGHQLVQAFARHRTRQALENAEDRERLCRRLKSAREALLDGRIPKFGQVLVAAERLQEAEQALAHAAVGDHQGRKDPDHKHDRWLCSCGWISDIWQDGPEWALEAWEQHVASEKARASYIARLKREREAGEGK